MGLEGAMMICAKKDGEILYSETFASQKDSKQVKEELQPGPIHGRDPQCLSLSII